MSLASTRLLLRALVAAGATGSLVVACGGRTDQSLATSNPGASGSGGEGTQGQGGGSATTGPGGSPGVGGSGPGTGGTGPGTGGARPGPGAGGDGGAAAAGGMLVGHGGAATGGHAGGHAGEQGGAGPGGACTGMCFVDFPCAPAETMRCISDTEFVPVGSFGCEHTCGACPCSGGSCEPNGAPQPCPTGSTCVKGAPPGMFDRCELTGGAGAGGATGKAECAPHGLCVAGEWCSHTNASLCLCGADGTFTCDQPTPWGMTIKVCDYGAAPCASESDPATQTALQQRFSVPCTGPAMGPSTFAQAADGTGECCYSETLSGCVGRPLVVESEVRVSGVVSSRDWLPAAA